VRERLGVKPGDNITFELTDDGRVTIARARGTAPRSKFETLRGRAGKGLSTDQIMALTRGS
jgi:bifunctional DNA-binding transcriptional regulator/antitoxin component of YhaV-PrlF toxin-antitoxin module